MHQASLSPHLPNKREEQGPPDRRLHYCNLFMNIHPLPLFLRVEGTAVHSTTLQFPFLDMAHNFQRPCLFISLSTLWRLCTHPVEIFKQIVMLHAVFPSECGVLFSHQKLTLYKKWKRRNNRKIHAPNQKNRNKNKRIELTRIDFQGMIYSRNVHKPFALPLVRANHRSCTDTWDRYFPCLRWQDCIQASGIGMLNTRALELITLTAEVKFWPLRCCKKNIAI